METRIYGDTILVNFLFDLKVFCLTFVSIAYLQIPLFKSRSHFVVLKSRLYNQNYEKKL